MLNSINQQAKIGLLFVALSLIIILSSLVYFFASVQPKLNQEYQSYATKISQAIGHELNHAEILEDTNLLENELQKILNYRDDYLRKEFIKGIYIEFNQHRLANLNRGLQRGDVFCKNCFKPTLDLVDERTGAKLGKVTYFIDPKNHQSLLYEFSVNFTILILAIAGFLLTSWWIIRRLWIKNISSQTQLAKATQYNQNILDTMQEILLLIDHHGRILDSNLAARKRLKVDAESINSHFVQEYMQTAQKNQRLLSEIEKLGADDSLEIRFHDNDFYGLLSASTFDKNDENPRFLLVIKDIQSLKTTQSRLDFQAKLAHSSRLKSLGEMATGIAHEINQPLATIRLGAEGIKYSFGDSNAQIYEVSQEIVNQVDRASLIINNMRSFSRVQPSPRDWMPVHEPINTALSFFEEQLRFNNIKLVKNIDYSCPAVLIERQKFEQIIVNLVMNARYALDKVSDKREKVIEVTLSCDHQFSRLVIADNGIGMDSITLDNCMEPFFTTKEIGEGTGLGLSIVHNILQDFDIDTVIESELGKGTSFIMKIPHKVTNKNENDSTG